MIVNDPGHKYALEQLDDEEGIRQGLWFVKREGDNYPGNKGHYPGVNLQEVFRACIDRLRYLQQQLPCNANLEVIVNLRYSIWLLENRAAERHGRFLMDTLMTKAFIELEPICVLCGHIQCGGKCLEPRTL